jgi:thiamine-monophosphate kinase
MSDRPGEFELIAQLFAPLAKGAPGALGLLDDAALLTPPPDTEIVITADALVEGVHFLGDDPPDSVAKKALRVNLSDLAAKGATPVGYLLTLSLPEHITMEWLRSFTEGGLAADQKQYNVSLLGGDTTSTPGPLTMSVTALGIVPKGAMLKRSGARPGDVVFVSGSVGDAGAGLALLRGDAPSLGVADSAALIARYRTPTPRLALGRALRGLASASLDVSDGLLADLGHIGEVSKVRLVIEAAKIPLSSPVRALWGVTGDGIVRAATAGDDYELAFTAPPSARAGIAEAAKGAGIAVHEIGRVEAGTGVDMVGANGQRIAVEQGGYRHF